jgi:hypothetical protein
VDKQLRRHAKGRRGKINRKPRTVGHCHQVGVMQEGAGVGRAVCRIQEYHWGSHGVPLPSLELLLYHGHQVGWEPRIWGCSRL